MINGTISSITGSDPSLVYGTWALVIVTLLGIWVTYRYTKKSLNETKISNDLLKTELKTRLRPLFQIHNTSSKIDGEHGKRRLRLCYTLKNAGTVDARKITLRGFKSNNGDISNIVKEWGSIENSYLPIGTIQVDGTLDQIHEIPWIEGDSVITYIVWIEYEYFDIKEKSVIVFPSFGGGQSTVNFKWFAHQDVIEAEQEWKDTKSGKIGF